MPAISSSSVASPAAMNRWAGIGPQVLGAGRPWPVERRPSRPAVSRSYTGPRATPFSISVTRCLGTPS